MFVTEMYTKNRSDQNLGVLKRTASRQADTGSAKREPIGAAKREPPEKFGD